MPFDFTNEHDFNNSYEPAGEPAGGIPVEQNSPESFRACLRYMAEEALRSGYLFPGHLLDCAADAMNVFVEDHKSAQAAD